MSDSKSESKKIYPSWRYHKDGKEKIVHSEEEHKALGSDWAHSPAHWEKKVDEVEVESEEKEVPKKKGK